MNCNLEGNNKNANMMHKRKKFTKEEDVHLKDLVNKYGSNNWTKISNEMKGRSQRQCRERWVFYLSSGKANEFTKNKSSDFSKKIDSVDFKFNKNTLSMFDEMLDTKIGKYTIIE